MKAESTYINDSVTTLGITCTVTSKSKGNVTIETYTVDKMVVQSSIKGNRVYDKECIRYKVSLWYDNSLLHKSDVFHIKHCN